MHRIVAALICGFFLTGTVAEEKSFFPVAVWYAGGKARAPMLERVTPESRAVWRDDLQKIRSLGFNTVRTWIEWTAGEPRQGEYHFEQMELLLELAEEAGLKVIVQVYVDSAPEWVGKKFPDGHFVAQNGQAIPSQAAPGFCFDHPGVRESVLNFFREAARRAGRSKAFYGWDIWSEPHIINWAIIDYIPNASFCYCPWTQERFRGWLKSKYGSVDALDKAWYRTFESWEEVEPPRFGTILSYADYLDWRTFLTEKLAEDLKARNSAVKEIVPRAVTSSHAAIPSVFTNPANGDGTPDDWMMSESVDYWGTSFYPKHSIPSTHWSLARRALVMDFIRSSAGEKGFYNGELQGGYGVRGVVVGQEIVADETELYTWGMVARGAKAINFYAFYPMSTGYEAGGYGLINLDGTLTERSKRAGVIASIINANAVRLLESKPAAAEAAVIVNRMATLVGGAQNTSDRLAIRDSTAGYHRMFFERNIPLDFLSAQRLTADQLRKYKLVIVPYPIQMSTQMAGQLEAFVREGGHLFVEARPGWNDESGRAQNLIPGFGWEKMLGVREKSVSPRTDVRVKWGTAEFGGSAMEERFDVLDSTARVVATFDDGSPAAFQKAFGKGSAIVLGTFAGIPAETKPVDMHPLGAILTQWAGLTLPDLKSNAPVELKVLNAPDWKYIFLLNHGKETAHVEYLPNLSRPVKNLDYVWRDGDVRVETTPYKLFVELAPMSTRVFRLDY